MSTDGPAWRKAGFESKVQWDAWTLATWYIDQPEQATTKTDGEIAVTIGWFRGGRELTSRVSGWREMKRLGPNGDVTRVRHARRHVDRHNGPGELFSGYSFGTTPNGKGTYVRMLYTPGDSPAMAHLTGAAGAHFKRSVQASNQHCQEMARQIVSHQESSQRFFKLGMNDHGLLFHDASKELELFGRITEPTKAEAQRLGVSL